MRKEDHLLWAQATNLANKELAQCDTFLRQEPERLQINNSFAYLSHMCSKRRSAKRGKRHMLPLSSTLEISFSIDCSSAAPIQSYTEKTRNRENSKQDLKVPQSLAGKPNTLFKL
jgi:hypothetical protein